MVFFFGKYVFQNFGNNLAIATSKARYWVYFQTIYLSNFPMLINRCPKIKALGHRTIVLDRLSRNLIKSLSALKVGTTTVHI